MHYFYDMVYPESDREVFVDRNYELMRLRLGLERIKRGELACFSLLAIRRSGKTILLREFVRHVLENEKDIHVVYVDAESLSRDPRLVLRSWPHGSFIG